MINKTHPIAQKIIKEALKHTEQLYSLLAEEAALLQLKTTPLVLSENTQHKNEVIALLNTFSNQVGQLLASEKIENDTGMSQYFVIAKQAGIDVSESSNDWQKLTELSKKCRTLNEQNGASIYILNQHSQRILNILKGKSETINTYGRNGRAKSNLYSNTLISV